jgi:hypothetical protein
MVGRASQGCVSLSMLRSSAVRYRPVTLSGNQNGGRVVIRFVEPDVHSRRDDLIDLAQNVVAEPNLRMRETCISAATSTLPRR